MLALKRQARVFVECVGAEIETGKLMTVRDRVEVCGHCDHHRKRPYDTFNGISIPCQLTFAIVSGKFTTEVCGRRIWTTFPKAELIYLTVGCRRELKH